jgi:hypothetical protein
MLAELLVYESPELDESPEVVMLEDDDVDLDELVNVFGGRALLTVIEA